MSKDFSDNHLDHYLDLCDRIAQLWLQSFPEFPLQAPAFRHLFIGLYKNRRREITKSEAGNFLTAADIKSPTTKAKVIARAIHMDYVSEQKSSVDNRVTLVVMTPKLEEKIRVYLSGALRLLSEELKPGQGQE